MSDTTCSRCGVTFVPRKAGKPQRFCSAECRKTFHNNNRKSRATFHVGQDLGRACPECGRSVQYGGRGRPPRFCSPPCATRHGNREWRNNPENQLVRRAYMRQFYLDHQDEQKAASRARYAAGTSTPEGRAAYRQAGRVRIKSWRQANPLRAKESFYRWYGVSGERHNVLPRDLRRLVHRYRGKCAYCQINDWEHLDHVVPRSRGGGHSIGNLVPACASCNMSKSAHLLVEWAQ